MLKVKSFKQSTGFCGPASLRMVLSFYGIGKSENELAKLSGATKEKGVGAEGLLKAVKELGLKGFMKDFSDVSDLKEYVLEKKIPVIVDWFCCEDGHYSVVVDIDEKNITLADPQFVRVRKMDLDTFKRVWFDFPNDFLKSKDEIIIRRMIVIGK